MVDLSGEFGDAVDPTKESTQQGSGHCSKMQVTVSEIQLAHCCGALCSKRHKSQPGRVHCQAKTSKVF